MSWEFGLKFGGYTLAVAVASAGATYLITSTQRIETAQQHINSLQEKNRILLKENADLNKEKDKLESWIENEPGSFPALKRRIKELEIALGVIEKNKDKKFLLPLAGNLPKANSCANDTSCDFNFTRKKGNAFYSDELNFVVGINEVSLDGRVQLTLQLPGKKNTTVSATVGSTWDFIYNGKKYTLILMESNFMQDSASFKVKKG